MFSFPPDEDVRRLASEILEGDEYADYRIDEEAWLAFFDRLSHWFESLPGRMFELWLESPALYWLLLGGLLLAALLLLFHVGWTVRAALIASAPDPRRPSGPVARNLLREAEQLAQRGRFLAAARRVEHACLELLLEKGVIELSRADSNRVLRSRLAQASLHSDQRTDLVRLLDRLEAHIFRDPGEDPDLYESWREFHGALRNRLPA